jgi:hypothetical protein
VNRLAGSISRVVVLAAGLSILPAAVLAQSPWTLNRSGFFFQNTLLYQSTDQFFDENGNDTTFADDSKFRDFTNDLYLEYGIRDWMGLVLNLPVKALSVDFGDSQPTLSNTGFGDLTAGLRFRTLQWPLMVSLQAETTMPTGYNSSVVVPALGDGVWNFAGRVLAGRSLYPIRGYVQGAAGYRLRTKNTSNDTEYTNQVLYNLSAGYWVLEKLLVIGRWGGNKAVGEGIKKDSFGGNVSLQYRISQFVNLSAGVFSTVGGTNTDAGTKFLVGIAFKGNQLGKYEGALSSTLEPTERDAQAGKKPSERSTPAPPPPPQPESQSEGEGAGEEPEETDEPQSGTSP